MAKRKKPIRVTLVHRKNPDLKLLARVLIDLALDELETENVGAGTASSTSEGEVA